MAHSPAAADSQPNPTGDGASAATDPQQPRRAKRGRQGPGRTEWSRTKKPSRREVNQTGNEAKRRRLLDANAAHDAHAPPAPAPDKLLSLPFTADDVTAEQRRPKRKVAVMIGYAGTGYKGMQINPGSRTIEGDLFDAFVAAGAISKANADDPKKSSLVRCARTDKGVHAAGNVISLKLIVEDPDVVARINHHLPPQIRVWGLQRTNGGFSCHQSCDSRWYEYWLPTYCLLPPHPQTFLGRAVLADARQSDRVTELEDRWRDVADFWFEAEKAYAGPVLDRLEPALRAEVLERMYAARESFTDRAEELDEDAGEKPPPLSSTSPPPPQAATSASTSASASAPPAPSESLRSTGDETADAIPSLPAVDDTMQQPPSTDQPNQLSPAESGLRQLRAALLKAKRDYRVSPERLQQLQSALERYCGTHNFHNYTVGKSYTDRSSRRYIRSFAVAPPDQVKVVDGVEWVALRVHGQSFMMHQIRKMVAAAALVVRCGTPLNRLNETYGPTRIAIPKAPGLGLLLDRPVFDHYNLRARDELSRDEIDFTQYPDLAAFKEREICRRIFEQEKERNTFHGFFSQVDYYHSNYLLWLTMGGFANAATRPGPDGEPGMEASRSIDEVLSGSEEDDDPAGGEG